MLLAARSKQRSATLESQSPLPLTYESQVFRLPSVNSVRRPRRYASSLCALHRKFCLWQTDFASVAIRWVFPHRGAGSPGIGVLFSLNHRPRRGPYFCKRQRMKESNDPATEKIAGHSLNKSSRGSRRRMWFLSSRGCTATGGLPLRSPSSPFRPPRSTLYRIRR